MIAYTEEEFEAAIAIVEHEIVDEPGSIKNDYEQKRLFALERIKWAQNLVKKQKLEAHLIQAVVKGLNVYSQKDN